MINIHKMAELGKQLLAKTKLKKIHIAVAAIWFVFGLGFMSHSIKDMIPELLKKVGLEREIIIPLDGLTLVSHGLTLILVLTAMLEVAWQVERRIHFKGQRKRSLKKLTQAVRKLTLKFVSYGVPTVLLLAVLSHPSADIVHYFSQLGSITTNLSFLPLGVLTSAIFWDSLVALSYFIKIFYKNYLDINAQKDLDDVSFLDDIKSETKQLLEG